MTGLHGVLRPLRFAALAAAGALGVMLAAIPAASGGFSGTITNSADSVATAKYFTCFAAISPDLSSAYFEWPLSDQYGALSASDISGNSRTPTFVGTTAMDASAPLGCPRDGGAALQFDGSSTYAYFATKVTNPQTFSLEAYFQTSVKGGKIIGFGGSSTTPSAQYDRQIYVNRNGGISFGVYNSGYHVISSPATTYADGSWHHVVATFSSTNGMRLYLDGALVASDPTTTAAEPFSGYWRAGYDTLGPNWTNAPANAYFTGRMRGIGVYTVELTPQQIANHAAPTFGS